MATHLHKQIRDAMKTALTGLATTGNRVFANRVWPLSAAELPAIRLFSEEEDVEQTGLMGQWRQRTLTLAVEACAKASITLDDTLDQIGKEIEQALAPGLTVDGQKLFPIYAGMTLDFEEADQPVGIKRHHFRLIYAAQSAHPDTLN
jgi:hypothetical protein